MDQQAIRRFIEAKFAERRITLYPFPHLIIENFFPDEVYKDILRYNPFLENSGSDWISPEKSTMNSNTTPFYLRKQINFHSDQEFTASPEAMEFWRNLQRTFLEGAWFVELMMQTFPEYFELRFGPAVRDPKFVKWLNLPFFLQRHDDDYFLGPHTDNANRIFTCLFSFADVPGYEEFGTQMLVHKDPFAISTLGRHHDWQDFDVVKTSEYRPNNFMVFFKTAHSFHAVKKLTVPIPNKRYGMQFQCSERRQPLFHQLPLASEEKAQLAAQAKAGVPVKTPPPMRSAEPGTQAAQERPRPRIFGTF